MTLFEFVEDLVGQIRETRHWENRKLRFSTANSYNIKYLSMRDLKGVILIEVGAVEQETTLSEFIETAKGRMKENGDWKDREIRFFAVDEDKPPLREYLSIYDLDTEYDLDSNIINIDIGTEEEDAQYSKDMLG